MDDLVIQAMAKWPNVPDCYGWLGLDARGRWYLRDAQVQACGDFTQARGDLLQHEKLMAFIGRNYAVDERGCWFFQNGPQRVFVELECAPWVWNLQVDGTVLAHTGAQPGTIYECWLDEQGRAFLRSSSGLGLVHSRDMGLLAQALEEQRWPLCELCAADMPGQFGFVLSPAALNAAAG